MRYLDWVDRFRLHLEEKQAAILCRLGHDAMDQAEYGKAEVYYREWLRLCPIDEQAYQELIRALLVMGKQTEAKQLYRKLEQMCREELGTAPMAESVQLMTRMMSS
jgi:DNA-binding SARP family transcriptional activator